MISIITVLFEISCGNLDSCLVFIFETIVSLCTVTIVIDSWFTVDGDTFFRAIRVLVHHFSPVKKMSDSTCTENSLIIPRYNEFNIPSL